MVIDMSPSQTRYSSQADDSISENLFCESKGYEGAPNGWTIVYEYSVIFIRLFLLLSASSQTLNSNLASL